MIRGTGKQNGLQRSAGRSEQGSAIVEMAIILPLMLLVMTGIATFSMALYQKLLLTDAVASAGRVFAAEKGQADPCADTWTALKQSAPGLSSGSITMTITYTPAGGTATPYGKTCTALGGTTGMSSGDNGQISASYPCVMQVVNIWRTGNGSTACTVWAGVAEDIQ